MRLRLVGALALAVSMLGANLRAQAPGLTKSYLDSEGGVSFRYPSVWTSSKRWGSYFSAAIAPNAEPMNVAVSFSPVGNYYAPTTLTGLDFLYRRVAAPDSETCLKILRQGEGGGKPEQVVINGVPFGHVATGEAGMSKAVSQDVYVTYRSGTCYLFEEDVDEVGAGVVPGKDRNLTAQERRALRRHLAEVMNSVRLADPAPAH